MPPTSYFAAGQDGDSALPVRKLRVLIVDDDRDTTLTLSALLREDGYETKGVHDGSEAMAALGEFDPDVLISDINMPGMSGWELARHIRKAGYRGRPILIAISGQFTKAADKLLSQSVGFQHFFAKPCSANVLLKVLAPLAASCR